jgi:Domain of unknown function (DUF222)
MLDCSFPPVVSSARLANRVAAPLAGLGGWDVPAGWGEVAPWDEACGGPDIDPYSGPPDGADAWAADVPSDVLAGRLAAMEPAPVREVLPAGPMPRECGRGAGFAAGGVADGLAPCVVLAGLTSDIWAAGGLGTVTDDELVGVLRAWRRLCSWVVAGELAAVAELRRRRAGAVAAGADPHLAEHVGDEIAAALTLTARGADQLVEFAAGLERLPATAAALAAGQIDRAKAYVIADEVSCLSPAHAAVVEAAVIGRAGGQTTGQLRASARRAVLAADPDAAGRLRETAEKEARVEVWSETSGTAALAGRDLAPADVIAADKRIGALARQLQAMGFGEGLDRLRARAYLALLLGEPLPGQPPVPSLTGGTAGSVNLTMPLAAWLGASEQPGEMAGFGPLPAADTRALAERLAGERGSRWCLTLTGPDGRAVAHGCARAPGSDPTRRDWELNLTIRPLAVADCLHPRESAGYVPSPTLRHVVIVGQRTCSFPGCRRPAARCDQDHTIPHDQGGRTCECNLAPLCRRHHRAKQVRGWRLDQPQPGTLIWTLPHGRTYRVEPEPYPRD